MSTPSPQPICTWQTGGLRSRRGRLLSALLLAAAVLRPAPAQVPISAGPYFQDFDALAATGTANPWTDNTTLLGWYASRAIGGAVTNYRASAGTDSAGGLYSFGAASAGERALGSIASGTPSHLAWGVRFVNDSDETLTGFTVSYTGEQWRNGGNPAVQTLAFSYQIGDAPLANPDPADAGSWIAVPELDFLSPTVGATAGALDGNAAAQRVLLSATVAGLAIVPGQEVFLRWRDVNDAGNDHGLAVDDVSVSFAGGPVVVQPPQITDGPASRTNAAGTLASFTVTVSGTPPFGYQWSGNGAPLFDGPGVAGANGRTLYLSNVLTAVAGEYAVVVTNAAGRATSGVARLTVLDPVITAPPQGRTVVAGAAVSFSVGAAGTAPLAYQWHHAGEPIADATTSAYNLGSVGPGDAGDYTVGVVNGWSVGVTSAPARLTVIAQPPTRLALWDFNDTNAPASAPPPVAGSGSAWLVGGVSASYAGGAPANAAAGQTNAGWNTTGYPAQGTSNKQAGVEFRVSTAGQERVLVTWEARASNTGSKHARLQYTVNGADFTDLTAVTLAGAETWQGFYADLTGLAGVDDNPAFGLRLVSEWESSATGGGVAGYVAAHAASSYGSGGTLRYDLVTVYGWPRSGAERPRLTGIAVVGGEVRVEFAAGAGDAAEDFTLLGAGAVEGSYGAAGGTITALGAGRFRASAPLAGPTQFYRVQRN